MSDFEFTYEHQFITELDVIEPDPVKQLWLSLRVENACTSLVRHGFYGYGFARVSWTRDLLAWYQTNGTAIYLLSIRYDLILLSRAA